MAAASTFEVAFNASLAEVLRTKHPLWNELLAVEELATLEEDPRLRPDMVVKSSTSQPVAVETEFLPAGTVETDAIARLGKTLRGHGDKIEQAIALRIPSYLRHGQASLSKRISEASYEYCLFSGDPKAPDRWPRRGWLSGGVEDLARCIEYASYSERLINKYIDIFTRGVDSAAHCFASDSSAFPNVSEKIAEVLNQAKGTQTYRMAMTIIGNALMFHANIAGAHRIESIEELRGSGDPRPSKRKVLRCWDRILKEVNYWPIFHVASMLLEPIRTTTATRILDGLAEMADELVGIGVSTMHDLSGRMFQKLITDRKFLATFYTLPASATLLAELAIGRMDFDWNDAHTCTSPRIADLSCGTGTLLSAAYHAVLSRHRRGGGVDAGIHRAMMEEALIAADIMPAATHMAASQLSSAHPSITFSNTRIYTMPYGVNEDKEVSIGSLDLMDVENTASIFATEDIRAHGGKGHVRTRAEVGSNSLDLAIVNPPFTRPTNHESSAVPIPSFAGFKMSADDQKAMSERLKALRRRLTEPAGHGNAGLASDFIDLAHAKAKPGGVVALVLPMAIVQGESWGNARSLLSRRYLEVTIVSIAASGSEDRAFSADTGMAEALVIATKKGEGGENASRTLFVNLFRRPGGILEAVEIARAISCIPAKPASGPISVGNDQVGNYIRASIVDGGCAAVVRAGLAQAMKALRGGALRLPRLNRRLPINMTTLGELGERGLLHRDIGDRGPFEIIPIGPVPDYPVLWSHSSSRERFLFVNPDREGLLRTGEATDDAEDVWASATRLHFNLDFRLNSQSLAACLTSERSLGGRAWPNFLLKEKEWENSVLLWANTTLGLMSFWWRGSRQQQGRSILTISGFSDLMMVDPRTLSDDRIAASSEILERFRRRAFLPANEAYRDPVRQDLDRAVLVDLLGLPPDVLDPLSHLRLQWCSEPSVHGGKGTRPDATGG